MVCRDTTYPRQDFPAGRPSLRLSSWAYDDQSNEWDELTAQLFSRITFATIAEKLGYTLT